MVSHRPLSIIQATLHLSKTWAKAVAGGTMRENMIVTPSGKINDKHHQIIALAYLGSARCSIGVVLVTAQEKLTQKDAELTELKQQYNQLLADANSKIALLTEEANKKLHLANQPEIPVNMSFRKALLSSGDVASFHNRSSRSIAVTANIERPSSGQSRIFDLTLDPGHTKEIGEREGWAFVSGDTVTLTQPEHKSLSFQAP